MDCLLKKVQSVSEAIKKVFGDLVYFVADFEGGNKNKRGIFTRFLLQLFIVEATQYF